MEPRRGIALVFGLLLTLGAGGCATSVISVTTQERDHQLVKRLNVATFHGENEGKALFRLMDTAAEDENTLSVLQLFSWTRENNRPPSSRDGSSGFPGSPGIHFRMGN